MLLAKYNRLDYPQNLWSVVFNREFLPEEIPADWEATLDHLSYTLRTMKEWDILQRYFKEEETLAEIGKRYGVCQERIRQIAGNAVRALRHPSRACIMQYGLEKARYMRENKLGYWSVPVYNTCSKTGLALSTPVVNLDLSTRATHCMHRAGVETVEDLLQLTESQLFNTRNMGKKTMEEILRRLDKEGLALREEKTDLLG